MGVKARIEAKEMKKYYEERKETWSRATSANQVFTEKKLRDEFNPAVMKLPREACDSANNPHSRGIIFAEDVTGSMGSFLLSLIKDEFPRLITQTYESVSFDPHIMFMGVGDVAEGDEAPLQVTQFETDLLMLEQLQKIWLEKKGGSNSFESYILPWYFAAKHIKMDCYDKRGEKGFLFTFGDEEPTPYLTSREISKVFGGRDCPRESRIYGNECLKMASEKFYCYHIYLHGNYYYYRGERAVKEWQGLMGRNRVCDLSDHHYLPELVTTIFKMYEGKSKTEAIEMLQDSRAKEVVKQALEWHEEYVSDVPGKKAKGNSAVEVF